MTTRFLILLIAVYATFSQLDAAGNKALFYVPTLSFSHVAFNIRLAELLAKNGYEVTLLVIDIDPNVQYGKTDKSKLIHVPVALEKDSLKKTLWENPGPFEDASPLNPKIFVKFLRVSKIMIDACFNLFQNHSLILQLEQEEFQLGFVEQYDACGLGLLQRIEVGTIVWLSATGLYRLQPEAIGINYPISYVPELFSTFSHRMSFFQRLENLLIAMVTEITHKIYSIDSENRLIRQSSIENQLRLSLLVYAANTAGVIANVSPLLDFPAPTSLAIVQIAGITVERRLTQNDLPTEWKQLADQSKDGFVLITFGSIAKTSEMPESMWTALEHAFLRFPAINFIIKHENSQEIYEQWKDNVYFTKWIPQVQLMSHPNYRGVLTHGGWSTILESIMYKRSMILMPLFADHSKNAKVVEDKGLGLMIDKMQIQNGTFVDAFEQILHNYSFVLRCRQYAQMFQEDLLVTTEQLVLHKTRSSLKQSTATLSRFYHPKQLKLGLLTVAYFDLLVLLSFLIFIIIK